MIGDWRSILPPPAAWGEYTGPFSVVSAGAAGMVAPADRWPRAPDEPVRRGGPAAFGGDFLIVLVRGLGRRRRGGRQDGRGFAPARHLGRGFIALGPFRLIAVLRRRHGREARKRQRQHAGAKKNAARK